jgi:hypothetical protein
MDNAAHRHEGPAPDGMPLSAAQQAELRWGLERVLLVHEQHDAADDLARVLQRALRHLPVVMLHDRRLPGGLVAEHLAIGPGGVTVVAAWRAGRLPAPLTVEHLRGVFGARAELLRDGTCADRTPLLRPVRERVGAVRAAIEDLAPVAGALCLEGGEDVARLRPLTVEGVLIGGPKAVAELAARDGDLHDYELAALVDLLDAALPPTL